jgi:hypothetical protein
MRTIQWWGTVALSGRMPLARGRYVAAAREFLRALTQLAARGVPIDPGPELQVREWTVQDVAVLRAVHETLGRMLDSRRDWDRVRRGQPQLPSRRPAGEREQPSTPPPAAGAGMENPMWVDMRPNQPPEGF